MNEINITDAQAQRPKIQRRIDAALSTLAPLVRHTQGGEAAIGELKLALMALEIQNRLEWELLASGKATMDAAEAEPVTTTPTLKDTGDL